MTDQNPNEPRDPRGTKKGDAQASESAADPVSTRGQRLASKQQAGAAEILDAAAKAFRRRGYSATSIDDVADILGCTKGRVYHYFRTKGDLFIGIHRRALLWALESVRPVAEQTDLSASARLEEMVRRHALHLMEHTDYMGPSQYHAEVNLAREGRLAKKSTHDISAMRRLFESYFVAVIDRGMASGEFRQGDPALVARAVLGATNWLSVWFHAESPANTPEGRDLIATEFSTFAMHGVISEAATDQLAPKPASTARKAAPTT